VNQSETLNRAAAEEEIKNLLDPHTWYSRELQCGYLEGISENYREEYADLMRHFGDLILEIDRDDNWEEVACRFWGGLFRASTHEEAIAFFGVRWEFASSFGADLSWPITEYAGARLEQRKATWQKWRQDNEHRNVKSELSPELKKLWEEFNRPDSYYELLHASMEYDPYTGELASAPPGSVELAPGSWLIPELESGRPEEAFGKGGERSEPYSKDWNARMREKYFNWPKDPL